MADELTIVLPTKLSNALQIYAEKRKSDPLKLALDFISERVPNPVEILTCCGCGKQFPNYKKKKFYCSATCYKSAAFPRLGISFDDIRNYYGSTIAIAAEALGVSNPQMRRVVKKLGISELFLTR